MAYAPPPSSSSSSAAAYKPSLPSSSAPSGTFLPGTKVQVGSHRVVIEKYLSEGGFAHVYVVRVPHESHRHELAVLKRVAVPDREQLAYMRTEVETMKKLQGHRHVVKYMDSHASQLKGGGYEVFLLMEYCSGGGLIDFMNTRLQHRLTEPEILKIFGDVAEGVACMHYLRPPLLHRDLKVENVLISKSTSTGATTYKVCDFGSAAPPRPAAKTPEEGHLIEEDVQKHTTMQYRSPEMIDVWRKQPIDEKADIWALGVFLYKLCYYTTPFENVGQMAILNASFKYPSHPVFSERLKKLIGSMLKESPAHRPNIYQVIRETCSMQGTEVPIKDIYASRTHSEARRNESLPSPDPPMAVGLQKQAPEAQAQSIPDIAPMRRGRPNVPAQVPTSDVTKPKPSPTLGDPFAALDSRNYQVRAGAVDELSKKYPSVDEFSIAHDRGEAFAFPIQPVPQKLDANAPTTKHNDLSERVTNALADQVFSQSKPAAGLVESQARAKLEQTSQPPAMSTDARSKAQTSKRAQAAPLQMPAEIAMEYKSTGTGASPPLGSTKAKLPEISKRPIWKVPDSSRPSSQSKTFAVSDLETTSLQPLKQRSGAVDLFRSKSQTTAFDTSDLLTSTSSRPSLEGHRPALADLDAPIARTKSAHFRQRPSKALVDSDTEFLRDQEQKGRRPSTDRHISNKDASREQEVAVEDSNIVDDMDYLRLNEDTERRTSHRHSLHRKSGSRHSNSLSSSAKNVLAGKFGDAFKLFERRPGDENAMDAPAIEPPPQHSDDSDGPILLAPGTDKEARGNVSDADSAIDETEDLPPEVRRELERQRLNQEERRVADAAAQYRSHIVNQGTGGVSAAPTKASTIQRRVQTLLDEAGHAAQPTKKTAEGYGRYTDTTDMIDDDAPTPKTGISAATVSKAQPPSIGNKPIGIAGAPSNPYPKTRPRPLEPSIPGPSASAPPLQPSTTAPLRTVSRPSVPPKAAALRTGGPNQSLWPATQPPTASKPSGGLAALLAKDLEGVPDYPTRGSSAAARSYPNASINDNAMRHTDGATEDLEMDFSRRYPSLSGIEMVETEIGGQRTVLKARDV